MIRVSKESRKLPGKVISDALTFFGAGGFVSVEAAAATTREPTPDLPCAPED